MSMYNMLFGENDKADLLLFCLGFTRADCGRYRDCYIEDDQIVIHTRNGGGNRETYQPVIDKLATHPCYVKDEDDSFDCTYANIYFRFPDAFVNDLKGLAKNEPDISPSDKWKTLLDSFKTKDNL